MRNYWDASILRIKRLPSPDGIEPLELPKYANPGDSGMDIRSAIDCALNPGEIKPITTELSVEFDDGYDLQIRTRSGLALKQGLVVLNSPGTIDSSFRGELKIILINHSKNVQKISRGDRIAQLVMAKVEKAIIYEVSSLSTTDRSDGGFGSTGVK